MFFINLSIVINLNRGLYTVNSKITAVKIQISQFSQEFLFFTLFEKQWQEWIALINLFVKSDRSKCCLLQRVRRVMKSDSFFCFGHKTIKKWKTWWKDQIWSKSVFHKKLMAPVTHYLKTTFSPVLLLRGSVTKFSTSIFFH